MILRYNCSCRTKISLDGIWDFQLDPVDRGKEQEWFRLGYSLKEKIRVPLPWQAAKTSLINYTGKAWYKKTFAMPQEWENHRVWIVFEAVDYCSEIWINGAFVGGNEGGYLPFEFDITDLLHFREKNELSISVLDPYDLSEIPHGKQNGWYTRISGIWQSVFLERRNTCQIQKVKITPSASRGEVCLSLQFQCFKVKEEDYLSRITIHHPTTGEVYAQEDVPLAQAEKEGWISKIKRPQLWSPQTPVLYPLSISIINKQSEKTVDRMSTYFGLRDINIANEQIYLNEKPLYIRGALDQSYYPDGLYLPPSKRMISKEIQMAKNLGLNLLRKHIKPEIPAWLELADKTGMLIWAEPANYDSWTEQARKRFKSHIQKMVERDYNHPSIIIWSIYNEEWGLEWKLKEGDTEKQVFLEEMYDFVKDLDPTRLVCDNSGWGHVRTDLNDYHVYFPVPDKGKDWEEKLDEIVIHPENNFCPGYPRKEQPNIVSEFGMWGLTDLDRIVSHYGQEPPWFDYHQGYDLAVRGTKERFYQYKLNEVFGSFKNMVSHSQKRQLEGTKYLIEEIRCRSRINGYVYTEFSDIEWESNGLLDYLRNPKEHYQHIDNFNGEVTLFVRLLKRTFWDTEPVEADFVAINNTSSPMEGVVNWKLGLLATGSFQIQLAPHSLSTETGQKIHLKLPRINDITDIPLQVELETDRGHVIEDLKKLTLVPTSYQKVPHMEIHLYPTSKRLKQSLVNLGYTLTKKPERDQVVVATEMDEPLLKFVKEGGRAVLLAEDETIQLPELMLEKLPQGEYWLDRYMREWFMTTSLSFVRLKYFPNTPFSKVLGWECSKTFPSCLIKGLGQTEQGKFDFSQVLVGYFEGWLENFGAFTIRKRYGTGFCLITTFRLINNLGVDPLATTLFHDLIRQAQS